jgi:hypothetical protein
VQLSDRNILNVASIARALVAFVVLLVAFAVPSWAQTQYPQPITREVNMSGPRFGLTMLGSGSIEALKRHNIVVAPLISQFGWQFEKRLYSNGDGITALTEWVPLISGLEQGVALPSLNWLVGVRTSQGAEFGIGPNITPLGVGLVIAGGVTIRSGALNVPLNFAVASSKSGARVSIMTGFNLRR